MATELFLMEEHKDILTDSDCLEEWKETVEKLELDGQKSLLGESKSPVPFPRMSEQRSG